MRERGERKRETVSDASEGMVGGGKERGSEGSKGAIGMGGLEGEVWGGRVGEVGI